MIKKTDVIIVGGGPAGAACALALRRSGADCLVLDQATFPRIKPCAGWITPSVIKSLGAVISDYPYGITHYKRFQVVIKRWKFGLNTDQYAIRRVEFDQWLLRQAGVPVEQHTVRTIESSPDGYTIDGEYFGNHLVGAGGTYCPVFRNLFKSTPNRDRCRLIIAMEDEFRYPHNQKQCRLWFLQDRLPGYAWFVPKANNIINVGVGGSAAQIKARGDGLKRHWQRLVEKLDTIGLVSDHDYHPIAHSYYLRQRQTVVQRERAYLVGDAAGLATRDMGEGIGTAIASGMRAATAILEDGEYRLDGIGSYSWLSLLGFR
ncbi:MAG: FAD-dependent oxidoreductase [Anaerolineae bacterium]|nr:FAD-dependent oxidoreductase [Anaerolineae bacterium]